MITSMYQNDNILYQNDNNMFKNNIGGFNYFILNWAVNLKYI